MRPQIFARRAAGWLAAGVLLAAGTVFAQDAPVPAAGQEDIQQSAYRSSIAQESLRKQTDELRASLLKLIQELSLNGLDLTGSASLSNAATDFSSLSREDMQKVIDALQNASLAADDPARQQTLMAAFKGQKTVVLGLKTLAANLAAEQARESLVNQIESLIVRQATNIRRTKILGDRSANQLNAGGKAVQSLVFMEQSSIGEEISLLFKTLVVTAESTNATAVVAKAVLDVMNSTLLKSVAADTTHLTQAGPFPEAVTRQAAVRDYLGDALRAALADEDKAAQLEEAQAQLDQAAIDQKDLTAAARQTQLDAATLAERQFQIDERSEVVKDLVKPLNDGAADAVVTAKQNMQDAAAAFARNNNRAAAQPPIRTRPPGH